MKRNLKSIIAILCAAVLTFAFAGAAFAEEAAEEDYPDTVLQVNFTCSAEYGTAVYWIQNFCDVVTEKTGGKVTFEYTYSNQLLPIMEIPQGVGTGLADISYCAYYMYGGVFPLNGKIIDIPFLGIEGVQEASDAWAYLYDKFPEMQAEFENAGLVNLSTYAMPPYQIFMAQNMDLHTPDDFKGVQIITQNAQVSELLTNSGAVPVAHSLGDWYTDLNNGAADGICANVLSVTDLSGCGELIKRCVMFGETGVNTDLNGFIMNADRFYSLPESVQQILLETGKEFTEKEIARYIEVQDARLASMTDNGAEMTVLTEDEVAAFEALVPGQAEAVIQGLVDDGNPVAADIYDALVAFLDERHAQ